MYYTHIIRRIVRVRVSLIALINNETHPSAIERDRTSLAYERAHATSRCIIIIAFDLFFSYTKSLNRSLVWVYVTPSHSVYK